MQREQIKDENIGSEVDTNLHFYSPESSKEDKLEYFDKLPC